MACNQRRFLGMMVFENMAMLQFGGSLLKWTRNAERQFV